MQNALICIVPHRFSFFHAGRFLFDVGDDNLAISAPVIAMANLWSES
jgi:hypothetical protein